MSDNGLPEKEVANPSEINVQAPGVDAVFPLVSDLGQLLLNWSWEGTLGLEDKIERVAGAYGQKVVSLINAESAIIQMGSREAFLKGLPGIPPLAALPSLKSWLIDVEGGKTVPEAAREKLKQIAETGPVYSPFLRIFGVMMLSFGFAIDIVGTWEACIVAFLTGIISGIFFLQAERGIGWTLAAPLLASFFVSLPIFIAFNQGWVSEVPGLLLISALFVFIPGDSITAQAVEIIGGRWSAGVSRLFYSIVLLLLLAFGGVFAGWLTGASASLLAPGSAAGDFPWWAPYPGHIIFTIGVALAFQMRWKDVPLAILVTLIVTAFAQGGAYLFGGNAGTFLAAIGMTVIACYIARKPKRAPAYVFIITPFFTLTPGSHGLRAFESLIGGQPIVGVDQVNVLFSTLIMIALGMIVGFVITKKCYLDGKP
jgi:uncharacterized membrane protein YjjP (DUF1212 family)